MHLKTDKIGKEVQHYVESLGFGDVDYSVGNHEIKVELHKEVEDSIHSFSSTFDFFEFYKMSDCNVVNLSAREQLTFVKECIDNLIEMHKRGEVKVTVFN